MMVYQRKMKTSLRPLDWKPTRPETSQTDIEMPTFTRLTTRPTKKISRRACHESFCLFTAKKIRTFSRTHTRIIRLIATSANQRRL